MNGSIPSCDAYILIYAFFTIGLLFGLSLLLYGCTTLYVNRILLLAIKSRGIVELVNGHLPDFYPLTSNSPLHPLNVGILEPVVGHFLSPYTSHPLISYSPLHPSHCPSLNVGIEPVNGHLPDSYLDCLQHIQKNGNIQAATLTLKTSMALQHAAEQENAGTIPEPQGTVIVN